MSLIDPEVGNLVPDNPVSLRQAVDLLQNGHVCAFGTETVYGLGAIASDSDAVLKIYQTKKRPHFNPLIAHCASMPMAESIAIFNGTAKKLATLWPGAVTLVLPLKPEAPVSDLVTAGLETIAVRIPAHPPARELIATVGQPLAAPSANPSGKISPTSAQMVRDAFADHVKVLDGGDCTAGLESTILAVDGDRVVQLRAGALARADIEEQTGIRIHLAQEEEGIRAPGMLKSHYAPNANLRLNVAAPRASEFYLGFGLLSRDDHGLNLSQSGDLSQAAHNLFAYLSRADAQIQHAGTCTSIAVAPIPDAGLGEAINDRLRRAAEPKTQ